MLLGTGVDMVRISRLRKTYEKYGRRFLNRVYTEVEVTYCLRKRDPIPSLAARFAVKEACFKALGGTRRPFWRDMEVVNAPTGKPTVRLHGRMAELHPSVAVQIAITHDGDYAVATATAEEPSSLPFTDTQGVELSPSFPAASRGRKGTTGEGRPLPAASAKPRRRRGRGRRRDS